MRPEQQQWIEEISLYLEQNGVSRSAGRIFALLMISPEPLTLDDLSQELAMSKASASLGTRFGEQAKLIQRVGLPGERKTFYRLTDTFWYRSLEGWQESHRKMRDLIAAGLEVLPEEEANAEVRERMVDLVDFMTYYLDEYARMYTRWMEQRAEQRKAAREIADAT